MSENYHGVSVRSETTMTDDLKARLDALHVWPQAVADAYAAELTPRQIDKLYAVGKVATEAADRIATLEAALADMTQQRDAAMAGAVIVRELVWEQLGERAWRAPSPLFGSFRVECYGGRPWQALWSVPGFCDTFVKGDFATADDAKRAIEARILAALTPDPDRMLALTAAAYEDAAKEIDCGGCYGKCLAPGECHAKMALDLRALTPSDALAALSRIEAQAEARGMRICADIYYTRCCADDDGDDVYREMTASADATEAAAKGGV